MAAELMDCPLCGGQAIILNKNGRWCAECTGKPAQVPDEDIDPEIEDPYYDHPDPEGLLDDVDTD